MSDLPLHPALVHIPIGLAIILPIVALWAIALRSQVERPYRLWLLVVVLQAMLLGSGLAAMNTGEADEELVEEVVAESAIEHHEERAELFVIGSGIALGLGVFTLIVFSNRLGRVAAWTTVVLLVVVVGLGIRTGEAGGELVYVHGAAEAHRARSEGLPAARGDDGRERRDEYDDDDRDEYDDREEYDDD